MARRIDRRGLTPLGKLLTGYLEERGMTQTELARMIEEDGFPFGMSSSKLSHMMHNHVRVYPDLFKHIQRALNLTDHQRASMLWAYTLGPEEEEDGDD